ncbi:Crp/Fnr family transcriptional regulator [Sphingomonas faeni]|uniref:Crp/Fnr family transcriptional regulator n=1 Tax=Sphingomonas faeni TaxID=185950 RepID=UPI00277D78AA|nr:Crp/Fnr family transcriptional regulator [Sphingomonas faeni]MDQ0840021.1 CRP-like cAMP-binding protein [Sphingomonas faeni]
MIGASQAETFFTSDTRQQLSLHSSLPIWSAQMLTRDEQYALEEIALHVTPVGPHTDIVREGEGTDRLFIVTKGWACRYATTRNGGRLLSRLLVPGDIANLDSLLFDRLDYGVRTITQTTIVALPRKRVSMLAAKYSGIARALACLAFTENAIVSQRALSLGRRSATERIAHLLCELSVRFDAEIGGESSYAFPLTQEVIGDALGLTAIHVNRTMRVLQKDGLIALENRYITIPDIAALRQACGFNPSYLHMPPSADAQRTRV